ncbi:MAG TPA: DUF5522 domain-containing protein [Pyrinomonadaceae bacterium]|jgi:hypothetical protein|nr:DUF5522 domain-containing protein [Pyrinomonadaceae bacterium]
MVTHGKQANADDDDDDAGGAPRQEAKLQEGIDYYLEDGLFVFTAAFLKNRGYCCESGCRHCPYDYAGKRAE